MTSDRYVILATGSRNHNGHHLITTQLRQAISETTAREVVIRHGACRTGADRIVASFCKSEAGWFAQGGRLLTEDPMPADWDHCAPDCPPGPHRVYKRAGDTSHPGELDTYCPKGGPRRNGAMVAKTPRPDICLAWPHGNSYGTKNCMRLALAAGLYVRRCT